ncbi:MULTISPECIES: phage holin [Paenibacillus]|uniref:phage holin n=1 Tax=Paenibacillus TaxID=44249 RepID=UPI00119E3B34|nr:phage holin [Paenibacillus sp. IHBB 10380]
MENNKWRNYGMWVSIVAAVLLVLSAAGKLFGFEITEELNANITGFAMAILGLLVILGIISNPKEGTGYTDKDGKANKSKFL